MLSCKQKQECTGGELIRLFEGKKKRSDFFSVGGFANTRLQEFPGQYDIEERNKFEHSFIGVSNDTSKDFLFSLISLLFASYKVSIKVEQLFQLNPMALPWQEN